VANQELVKVLKQGAKIWNQWRSENSTLEIDLTDAVLSSMTLSDTNLSNVTLINADLRGAILSSANMDGGVLINADLRGAILSSANLRGANLCGADLRRATLKRASLINTNLSHTSFVNAVLKGAYLSGARLNDADLSEAKLNNVDLSRADLSRAKLVSAKLSSAKLNNANLSGANLGRADLSEADLSKANLSEADLTEANLIAAKLIATNLHRANLHGANLIRAGLSYANFSYANLSGATLIRATPIEADFRRTNLSRANLQAIQALLTNFTGAIFTGACLEDWSINSETTLDEVVCEYVYLKRDNQERRPSNGFFKQGEFTSLFRKALETVDLIFIDGIDWQAFFQSFQELRSQYDNLSIQAIEKKSGGAFVIRLEVSQEADKAAIEYGFKEFYEMKLQLQEQRYRAELHAKDREIEIYKRQSADMFEIAKLQASRPINVSATAESQLMENRNIHMGSGNYNERIEGNYVQGDYINMSQDLTQAAQQIQDLLKQLQNQGLSVEDSQQQVATDLAKQAETNTAIMGKLVFWGKAMANKASETTVSEAAKIVFKLALSAAGVPLS
jgi:uncharacterized protein YjbI with pentapeptide repeats